MTTDAIRLTASMLDARDTMRRFWGDRYDEKVRGERWRVRTRSPRMVWLWCETRSSHGKYMHLPAFIKWAATAQVVHIAQPKEKTEQ